MEWSSVHTWVKSSCVVTHYLLASGICFNCISTTCCSSPFFFFGHWARSARVQAWLCVLMCWWEVCKTEGDCCIIHECVPPCAWTAVTRNCQQCILERDGTGCAEDTLLQGPLPCGGRWAGPGRWVCQSGAGAEAVNTDEVLCRRPIATSCAIWVREKYQLQSSNSGRYLRTLKQGGSCTYIF